MRKLGFALILLLYFGIAPALACTPTVTLTPSATPVFTPTAVYTATPFPTITDYAQSAPVIFAGTVLAERVGNFWPRRYEISVSSYLKGSGYDTVYIDGYGYGTDCLPMIWEGEQRIFFVQEHTNSAGIPIYRLIRDYSVNSIDEVSLATGQSNPPQPLPFDIQLSRIAENGDLDWLYIPLIILIVMLVFVLVALYMHLTKRRKSKAKREELL